MTALNSIDKCDEESEDKEMKGKDDEIDEEVNDEVVMKARDAKLN